MKKGQMFLIGGIVILIGFFLLKNTFSIFTTIEEKRFQEAMMIDRQAKNVVHEYEYMTGMAALYANPNNRTADNLHNFSSLLRDEEDIEIFYTYVYYNGTSSKYFVTVGNFLNDRINATVNVTNSTTNGLALGIIEDRKNATAEFSSSISSDVLNVTVTYNLQGNNITEKFYVKAATNFATGFFDVKMKSKEDFVRIKSVYNVTW